MTALAAVQRRLAREGRLTRARVAARWAIAGAVTSVALTLAMAVLDPHRPALLAVATFVVVPIAAALAGWWRGRTESTPARTAARLDAAHAADNLVVTAEWLGRTGGSPWIDAVAAAATRRLDAVPPTSPRAVWLPAGLALAVVVFGLATVVPRLGVSMRASGAGGDTAASGTAPAAATSEGIADMTVFVEAPAYLGGGQREWRDVTTVEVPEGAAVSVRLAASGDVLDIARDAAPPRQVPLGGAPVTVALDEPLAGVWTFTPRTAGRAAPSRVLALRVVPDAPPTVRIIAPGRDRRQALPLADLPVRLEAADDHALADLRLRFTRVSGSGESFTFEDRDVPVRTTRTSPGAWTGTATLPLASLGLEDGDSVVYRGVAVDRRPGATPVESDAFIVEVGPLRDASAAGGGGEDVDPEDKHGISQQMVIVKTERLHARRTQIDEAARLEEAQGLAAEQRMVRAEFVFLMGGEVEDEVEEAAHSHDLAEGRLENEGAAALLEATRAMSRAEARLTAGDTAGALVAEREALRHLITAFDRRRFLLRPVAERARLDPARRLQGEPPPAAPQGREAAAAQPPPTLAAVAAAAESLAAAVDDARSDLAPVAARLAALGDDPELVSAAAALAGVRDLASRRAALADAQRVLARVAGRVMLPAPAVPAPSPVSPAVAEALRRGGAR